MEDDLRDWMVEKMEGGDAHMISGLLSEADKHFDDATEHLERLESIITQFDHAWLNHDELGWILTLKIRLKRFDEAFEIVENLFTRKRPYGGLIAYSRLQKSEEPWLVEKRLEFLERAAMAGLYLARNELNKLEARKYGQFRKIVYWIKSIPLILYLVRINSKHPSLIEGVHFQSKAYYNRLYEQRGNLRRVAFAKKHSPSAVEKPTQNPGNRPLPLGNNVDWKPSDIDVTDTGSSTAYLDAYPKADPWEQLSPEELERYMSRLQDGDISYAIDLAYDGAVYPNQDKAQLLERSKALSKLNTGQLGDGTLTAFAIMRLNLALYDEAFQMIDDLFARGYPDAGYSAYCTLKDVDDPQIRTRGLEYLDRAARDGHVLALFTQTHIKYSKYGKFGKRLSARHLRKLRDYATRLWGNDPRRTGYELNALRGYNLRYQKRENMPGWFE